MLSFSCRYIVVLSGDKNNGGSKIKITTHHSSSPHTSYTTQTNPSKSTKTKLSCLITFYNILSCLLLFTVMPKNLFPSKHLSQCTRERILRLHEPQMRSEQISLYLNTPPTTVSRTITMGYPEGKEMRLEKDILRLPSCRMKPWLRKVSKIAILPILRLLNKLHTMFLPRQ